MSRKIIWIIFFGALALILLKNAVQLSGIFY